MKCHAVTTQCLFKAAVLLFIAATSSQLVENAFAFTNAPSACLSRSWQTEDGLPSNFVQGMIQTRDGYLWIATYEGLAKFDGMKFTLIDPPLSPAARNKSFTAVHEAKDGTVWCATDDGRLMRIKGEQFEQQQLPDRLQPEFITSILEGSDNSLWLGTSTNGLARLKNGKLERWTQKDGFAHFSVRALCEDGAGNVCVATGAGLQQWKDGKFKLITVQDGLLHNSIRALCADREGNLWMGSHFGLTRMNGTNFTHFTKREGLAGSIVSAILQSRDGQIWVGTFSGLNRIAGGKMFTETQDDGASFDRVQSLMEDREGNIWVGTRDGLFQLRPRVITAFSQQRGLTHNTATCVMEDRDGNIWTGFWGGGLNRIEPGGSVTAFTLRERLSSDLVLSLHQSRRGNIWVGTDYDGGLNLYRGDQFAHFREAEGMREDAIKVIQDDSQTNLWIGTRTALLLFRDNTFQRFTMADGLPADTIEAITETRDGRVWFGTLGGLAFLEGKKFTSFTTNDGLSHNSVTAIYEDADGTLWLGTRGGGLNRFRDGKFSAFTTRDGLLHNEINGVVEDDFGFLWMSSRHGIFRASKNDLNRFAEGSLPKINGIPFDKSDGMLSAECKGAGKTAAWKARDGRLWFPTSKGIVAVDPRRVTLNSEVPPVVIENAAMNGKPVDISAPLELVTDKPEFTFYFTALSFTAPEKVRFKYKLEGMDDHWIDAGNLHEARYVHLPEGQYHFRVIAANNNGVWNAKGASLSFAVAPPFWRTFWFLSLCGFVFVGATTGAVRYVSVKKYKARLRAMEQEHAVERERMRIAQDMHDELGARMTEVMLLTDFASNGKNVPTELQPQLNKISYAAREVVRNLDAIVWTVNPENDSLERVVGYIQEFSQAYLELANIRCWFDFPEHVPHRPMSSEVRHHLFLVLKEALNNIVKHSGATETHLRLCIEKNGLLFFIKDNGKGFSMTEDSSFGNGLKNMRRRLQSVGGKVEIDSQPGKGTEVRVHILFDKVAHYKE